MVGVGHGVGHDGLDVLLAGRAVVAVDGVLGDDGAEVLEEVLDGPRACAIASLKLPAAAGAAFETMLLVLVDALGRGPARPAWPGLAPGLPLRLGAGGLV